MKMKKIGFIILLSTFLYWECQKADQEIVETVVPVRVLTVKPDSIAKFLEITGNLEAVNDAVVVSKISERLVKIVKNVGSSVKENETVATMENKIWRERLNQAEAALKSIEARHEQVKQDYERYQRLYQEKAVSQQQWEKIRSSMQEAEASLAQLQAAYSQAREQFEETFIKAPFDGIVGSFYFDEGQMIQTGQPVVKIVNTDLMKAKLNIPDVQINKIQLNQLVNAKFPSLDKEIFRGNINRIDPAIDPLSRTIQVEAIFSNKNKMLKSGMYGVFHIEIEKKINSFVIPDNAIINRTEVKINPQTGTTFTEKNHFVYLVKSDSVVQVLVQTGISSGNVVEIIEGLSESDKVIIVGQRVVKPGQKVRIVE